ncbi:MAG: leucine-rich repeat protein [Acetobacterium sp.]|nr:leucine-rich repeat protein [Bacillota bacterium]MDP2843163.1 leucine-rich repeat protein [Acetobacterium sp.]
MKTKLKKIGAVLAVLIVFFPTIMLAENLSDADLEALASDAYVSGDYILEDLNVFDVIIINYRGKGGNIDVSIATPKNGVIDIGPWSFADNTNLTGIILRRTANIYESAFIRNYFLSSVVFGPHIKTIGANAFRDCVGLKSIDIPTSVVSIHSTAFDGCTNLTIYGVAGSYAEQYANDNGIPFVPKGSPTTSLLKCYYRTHIQNIGWQEQKSDGEMSGTSGKGLRLEAIQMTGWDASNKVEFDIFYQTHIQNIGWQGWKHDKEISGTSGMGYRLEAIRVMLPKEMTQYDIYYQVHAQNFGWLDWAKNGQDAGTAGFGYRLEGIRVLILPKGSPAPGPTKRPFVQVGVGVGSIDPSIDPAV